MTDTTQATQEPRKPGRPAKASLVQENQVSEIEVQDEIQDDELELLKHRADILGLGYSKTVTADQLRAKIKAAMEEEPEPKVVRPRPVSDVAYRQKQIEEGMALVRVRIANMNPSKADIPGEIITTGNKYLGTVKKFIPFGEGSENGYHVPRCLLNVMRERKYLHLTQKKDKYGTTKQEEKWLPEFSIEELPPLTATELRNLAVQQAAAQGLEA